MFCFMLEHSVDFRQAQTMQSVKANRELRAGLLWNCSVKKCSRWIKIARIPIPPEIFYHEKCDPANEN